jgi:hypothetical protein
MRSKLRTTRTVLPLAVIASVAALALATAGSASARGLSTAHHTAGSAPADVAVTVLNDTVLAPFNLSVSDGHVLVADGGTSLVSRIKANGGLHTIAAGPQPGEVTGVAQGGGAIAYTSLDYTSGAAALTIKRSGSPDVVADISGFEAANNPDQHVWYGVTNPSACVRNFLESQDFPVGYHGVVDSHAYSVAYAGAGWWYVGDAAGNDIVKVSPAGVVSLVRVIPPQPTTFTAQSAKAAGLPKCFKGVTYKFEPVPTDIEVHNGLIYLTTLPGGPEDPSFGARGKVWRIGAQGHLTLLGSGFLGATNLAVTPRGQVFVTELFGGQVSTISHGQATPVQSLPGAVSVEYANGWLYVGTLGPSDDQGNPTGPGSVVRFSID